MSDPISEGGLNEIRQALFAGRKIEAIKLYRKYSGLGLREAKDAVEEMERKLRVESPERFLVDEPEEGKQQGAQPTKSVPGVQVGKGCFGMVAAILLAAILALVVLAVWH
jgi:hypothetical protein